jgi:hypothetical protein
MLVAMTDGLNRRISMLQRAVIAERIAATREGRLIAAAAKGAAPAVAQYVQHAIARTLSRVKTQFEEQELR